MTWQRIDENTYIDDTLVTCAEYQLFIEEMREQGRYYQPDHWTSYQFSTGDARKPILGVRKLDAMAFCEWLNQDENKNWIYTLPTSTEAFSFPLNSSEQFSYGYWSVDGFEWVIPGLQFVPRLNMESINNHFVQASTQYGPYDRRFVDDFQRATNNNYPRAIDVERFVDFILLNAIKINDNNHSFVESLLQIYKSDRFSYANVNMDHILSSAIDFAYSKNIHDREYVLELIMRLLTLQERIAGRSPAFEGIRLVRERVR